MKQLPILFVGVAVFMLGIFCIPFLGTTAAGPTYLMIAGIAIMAVYLIRNWRILTKRSTFFGLNAVVMSAVVVVILSVIYLIADQRNQSIDLTASGKYTLDTQTKKILDGLSSTVKLLLFVTPDMKQSPEFLVAKDLIDQYTRHSDKVTVEILDPSKDYETAVKYAADLNPRSPTLIAEMAVEEAKADGTSETKTFKEKAAGMTQEDLSNAIMKVTHRESVKAYFLVGHYERELDAEDPTGLAFLKQFLSEENIEPTPLRLGATAEIPEDADIIALVGPKEDLSEVELEALDKFVMGGGGLFVGLDPGDLPATALKLREFGFEVGKDEVISMEVGADSIEALLRGVMTARPSKNVPIAEFATDHDITKDLGSAGVQLIEARSVDKIPVSPEGTTMTALAKSEGGKVGRSDMPTSWAEKNPEALVPGQSVAIEELFDPAKDTAGPVSMIMAAEINLDENPEGKPDPEHPSRRGKVVVAGDSDFITNGGMQVKSGMSSGISRGHLDLALNTFNWLAGQVDLISIREPETANTSVTLDDSEKKRLQSTFVWVIPVLIGMVGVAVVFYRRWMYI